MNLKEFENKYFIEYQSIKDNIIFKKICDHINQLEKEIEELSYIDFENKQSNLFSKEKEYQQFVQDLFDSLSNVSDSLSKEEILENLKNYILNWANDYKIKIKINQKPNKLDNY